MEKSLGKWISVLYRQFQVYINRELKVYSLNSSQYIYLVTLYQEGPMRQDELSKQLHIDKAATARALKQLEANNYIERAVNKDDKRVMDVWLTKKAMDIKDDLQALLKNWTNVLGDGLDEESFDAIIDQLMGMSERALTYNEADRNGA